MPTKATMPRPRKQPMRELQPDWSALMPMLVEDIEALHTAVHGLDDTSGMVARLTRVEVTLEHLSQKVDQIYEHVVLKSEREKRPDESSAEKDKKYLTVERLALLFLEKVQPFVLPVAVYYILNWLGKP